MAVGCGAKCAKVMLIVFNIIFWLSGCALLGVGIWLRVDKSILEIINLTQINAKDPMLNYAAYLLIAVGAFVFLVGFLGCCGAIKENKCCLGMYIFLLLIVMAAELAAGILVLVYKNQIIKEITTGLKEELKENKYLTKEEGKDAQRTTFGGAMDAAQLRFKCCGILGKDDYTNSNYSEEAEKYDPEWKDFPFTCCKFEEGTDLFAKPDPTKIVNVGECQEGKAEYMYAEGCQQGLEDFISQHALIVIGIGIGIACLEIFGFIFAVCLCRNTGDED